MSFDAEFFLFREDFPFFLRGPSFLFTLVVYIKDSLGYLKIWKDPLIRIFLFRLREEG